MSTITDQKTRNSVVDEVLRRVNGMPREEAASLLGDYGFKPSAIQRWRQVRRDGRDVPMPRGEVRKSLERFKASTMGGNGDGRSEPEAPRVPGISPEGQRAIDAYWLNELQAIRRSGDPERLQTLHRDSVASAIGRLSGLIEARAREVAERASEVRALFLAKAEDNDTRRMVELIETRTIPREAFGDTDEESRKRGEAG